MSHRSISSLVILIISLITSSNASELIFEAYPYATIGTGPILIIPNIGIGYRQRAARVGYDSAIGYSTIGYAHQLEGHLIALYYLNPCQKNSNYLGCGVAGSGIFCNDGKSTGLLAPDFVFGKEFKDCRRQFVEVHIEVPSFLFNRETTTPIYFPLMYLKYGVSF